MNPTQKKISEMRTFEGIFLEWEEEIRKDIKNFPHLNLKQIRLLKRLLKTAGVEK